MSPRRKSRFERLLSYNQHRKRRGAAKLLADAENLAAMKSRMINEGQPLLTRGSNKQLDEHFKNLRREFSGKPELLWHHAKLIVLIRREFQTADTYAQFRALWDAECAFLCEHLNLRWLVSAADTLAEYDHDAEVRAVAMMSALFVNSIKMHESERYICNSETLAPELDRIVHVKHELVPLFEGLSCFTVGTDDTLRNLRWRLQPFFEVELAGAILKTTWDRCQVEKTVFARMRRIHERKRTSWWDD